jgi:hypothetical protein
MKLSEEVKEFMTRVLRVARLTKVEGLVFEQDSVRGFLKPEGVMICHRTNIPTLGFQALGVPRIDVLSSRLDLMGDKYEVETKETAKGLVSKLTISTSSTEVEFKCGDPAVMAKAPRIIKDPIAFTFDMEEDSIALLANAPRAVKGEALTLSGSEEGVIAKLNDIEGDKFQHVVSGTLIYTPESTSKQFYKSYKNKILIPLLKECLRDGKTTVNVTDRGMINLTVLGISVYFAPEM